MNRLLGKPRVINPLAQAYANAYVISILAPATAPKHARYRFCNGAWHVSTHRSSYDYGYWSPFQPIPKISARPVQPVLLRNYVSTNATPSNGHTLACRPAASASSPAPAGGLCPCPPSLSTATACATLRHNQRQQSARKCSDKSHNLKRPLMVDQERPCPKDNTRA